MPPPQLLFLLLMVASTPFLARAATPPASPPVPRTPEVQAEIDALLAFRAALRDPYAAMAGWDAASPSAPCSWRGIACAPPSGAGRVVELQLPRLRLAGPISPALASLPYLQKLSLRSNSLSGVVPPALARLCWRRKGWVPQRRERGACQQQREPSAACVLDTQTAIASG
jgi:hypothetical protein